ncbi:Fur family transcriptional regulator [Levilactobacillus bambusae]|uniref:Transcriptional repressor n=1 Tax=Levilactobacillus bambusae TaxID=2024736 RepID=A0A2V1MYF3_9LACO|nr:transcriptional repressor [Levilactobacillus bambusae]PWG00044.1 transcriptional repressor [Levilactobacillus bambusae]
MEQTLATAEAVLRQNHFKVTKQRQAMLEFLIDNQHHYTNVTTVDDFMHREFPGMSHNTIYRNIKEFKECGLVEQQLDNDQATVKYTCDFTHQHHHHFICTNCGKVIELKMCPTEFFAEQLPGCEIDGHRFELYGLCADCK